MLLYNYTTISLIVKAFFILNSVSLLYCAGEWCFFPSSQTLPPFDQYPYRNSSDIIERLLHSSKGCGLMMLDIFVLSYPTTETFSGTSILLSQSAFITPAAISSFIAKTASGKLVSRFYIIRHEFIRRNSVRFYIFYMLLFK